jgi:SWIM zinc finger
LIERFDGAVDDRAGVGNRTDDASQKSAKGLTTAKFWTDLGSTDTLVWGKCAGSGKLPYQVSVELTGPAFRCTCPSRKFPCKHGLALLLMWSANDGSVSDGQEVAAFAEEWANDRATKDASKKEKEAKKAEMIAAGEDIVDPVARAQREAKRAKNIDAGLEDLDRWMCDLVRNGFANAKSQPFSYWDHTAARLVDAQAPGLAEQVRDLGSRVISNNDWTEVLLKRLSHFATIIASWRIRDQLDHIANAELRKQLGWARSTDEIRAGETITDTWIVAGTRSEATDRMASLRTWLHGETSGQTVMLLDFSVGTGNVPLGHITGTQLHATIALYPGATPQRGLVVNAEVVGQTSQLLGGHSMQEAAAKIVDMRAENPWIACTPLVLEEARFRCVNGAWYVADANNSGLPIDPAFVPWKALAYVGNDRTTMFGEWDGHSFMPLTIETEDELLIL